eukprot:scaffold2117_cov241-Pinguiococcus_pyrenoidosus.AAC.20
MPCGTCLVSHTLATLSIPQVVNMQPLVAPGTTLEAAPSWALNRKTGSAAFRMSKRTTLPSSVVAKS